MTDGFPPEHLDLEMLMNDLANRMLDLVQFETIVDDLPMGSERDVWADEVSRVKSEITQLDQLIADKKEFDRERANTAS